MKPAGKRKAKKSLRKALQLAFKTICAQTIKTNRPNEERHKVVYYPFMMMKYMAP